MTTKPDAARAVSIVIPRDLEFSALRLARDPGGDVSFDAGVIGRIEAASGLPEGFFMGQPEDALAGLIVQWYEAHLADGGDPDPIAEDLKAEVGAEDAAGQHVSHAPGRA